jgi:hypothetical protein
MLVFFNSLKNLKSKLSRLIFTIITLVNKEEVNLEIQVEDVVNHQVEEKVHTNNLIQSLDHFTLKL